MNAQGLSQCRLYFSVSSFGLAASIHDCTSPSFAGLRKLTGEKGSQQSLKRESRNLAPECQTLASKSLTFTGMNTESQTAKSRLKKSSQVSLPRSNRPQPD